MSVLRMLVSAALSCAALTVLAGFAQAETAVPGAEHCVVNVRSDDALNLRAAPSAQSPVVGRMAYGACGIQVTAECAGSWCPVEDGHAQGWVHRHYIDMVSPALYCVSGVAAGDILNLRAFPSIKSAIVKALATNQCDIAFLPYSVGKWQKIRVAGYEGWVNRSYLSGQ